MMMETQNALLVHKSAIHANQQTLENMRAMGIKSENEREQFEKFTKDRHRESGQVIMSIKNLHNRCLATSRSKQARTSANKANSNKVASSGGSGNATTAANSAGTNLGKATKSPAQQMQEFLRVIQYRITDLQNVVSRFKSGAFDVEEKE